MSNTHSLTTEEQAALAACESIDATLDQLAHITRGRTPITRHPDIPNVRAAARALVDALARLEARQADAQRDIPRLEARREQLEAAVQTAGAAYSRPEAKAARQRLEEERGTTHVAIAEAKRRLTALTNT